MPSVISATEVEKLKRRAVLNPPKPDGQRTPSWIVPLVKAAIRDGRLPRGNRLAERGHKGEAINHLLESSAARGQTTLAA